MAKVERAQTAEIRQADSWHFGASSNKARQPPLGPSGQDPAAPGPGHGRPIEVEDREAQFRQVKGSTARCTRCNPPMPARPSPPRPDPPPLTSPARWTGSPKTGLPQGSRPRDVDGSLLRNGLRGIG